MSVYEVRLRNGMILDVEVCQVSFDGLWHAKVTRRGCEHSVVGDGFSAVEDVAVEMAVENWAAATVSAGSDCLEFAFDMMHEYVEVADLVVDGGYEIVDKSMS